MRASFLPTLILVSAVAATTLPAAAMAPDALAVARADLSEGRADDAIGHLQPVLAANPDHAEAHNLLCRVYYQEERWDEAIAECSKATSLAGNVSPYHWWLGRAYGRRAVAG